MSHLENIENVDTLQPILVQFNQMIALCLNSLDDFET